MQLVFWCFFSLIQVIRITCFAVLWINGYFRQLLGYFIEVRNNRYGKRPIVDYSMLNSYDILVKPEISIFSGILYAIVKTFFLASDVFQH